MAGRKVFVCIPLMDELENVPALMEYLRRQTFRDFVTVICVNQPDSWWNDPEKRDICRRNHETLKVLETVNDLSFHVIDRSSPGKGWNAKHFGVGWARKTAMDKAAAMAVADDLIVTMDGDTEFSPVYLASLADAFLHFPEVKVLSVPYYHRLTGHTNADRAILRYEIYMRTYAINMLRIQNPYAFTALGSAIACTADAYLWIGGITPHKSGEDFYFVQKLRKSFPVLIDHHEKVYPAARFSDRVFFGTGPAMIKGNSGDWSGYPIYDSRIFDEIKESFDAFRLIYDHETEIPMSEFLKEKFGEGFGQPLRENVTSREKFVKACQHKIDGLRILQYLKWRQRQQTSNDEENLRDFFNRFFPDEITMVENFKFGDASVEQMDGIRNFLMKMEEQWQQTIRVLR